MIPIIAVILFVGVILFLRKFAPPSISLSDEKQYSVSKDKTGDDSSVYDELKKVRLVPRTAKWRERWKRWRENELMILIGFVLLCGSVAIVFPNWWVKNVALDPQTWGLIVILLVLASFIPRGKTLFHHTLGKIGVLIVIVLLLVHFIVRFISNPEQTTNTNDAPKIAGMVNQGEFSEYLTRYRYDPENREVALETINFWRSNVTPEQAGLMTTICFQESGFRQFEKDGKTLLRGKENPKDVGVCQVNEDIWGKKPADIVGEAEPYDSEGKLKPDYDLATLKGNLLTSLWIFKKYGGAKWNVYEEATRFYAIARGREMVEVTAGFDEPSARVDTPNYGGAIWPSGKVWVLQSGERRTLIDRGDTKPLAYSPWHSFQSTTRVPIKVIVIR